ncbi:hypothetical protein ACP70R_018303 [Stipagrostis hirtigluma subsp. patula]
MASRRTLAATVCLLVLQLLLALGGAVVEARPGPPPARHRVAPRRLLSTNAPQSVDSHGATGDDGTNKAFEKTWTSSVHRKAAAKSKPPKGAPESVVFDVGSYGAVGDGRSDDTKAFQKAWAKACSSPQPAALLVPAGKKYLVKEIVFAGSCKSKVTFKHDGTIVAPQDKADWSKPHGYPHWIHFSNIDSLTVTGKGTLDGNGKVWWKNSCRINKKLPCTHAPTTLIFSSCKHLKVENMKLINSPQFHLWVESCHDVTLSRLTIASPGNSPGTDGIHVANSEDVRIIKANIKSGDDCISVETGTKNLYATKIECGPGHGISIGSLGDDNSKAQVSNITIDTAHLTETMFGARIKSWQGGSGYAKDIKFLNLVMDNVKNPIIIDQNYCTMADPAHPKPCKEQKSAVQFSNILFKNIKGTSATEEAIKLHCSKAFPCRDVVLQDIDLKMKGGGDKKIVTTSTCENAILSKSSNVSPPPCTSGVTKDDKDDVIPEDYE